MHIIDKTPKPPRTGIVLLLVMAMLALFAAVAISFVIYAENETAIAGYGIQAQNPSAADVEPELLLNYFLSQFIYDTDNVDSAMRGHSLARSMYGQHPNQMNTAPFNGIGRARFPLAIIDAHLEPSPPPSVTSPPTRNNLSLVNYQRFDPNAIPRVPETDAAGFYFGGNVQWTYPDLNNMFLAAVNSNGEVLMPSFHRPWNESVLWNDPALVTGAQALPLDAQSHPLVNTNPEAANPTPHKFWTNVYDPWAKYMTLRPHASYHSIKDAAGNVISKFPDPEDQGGDVKNLEWGRGTLLPPSIGTAPGAAPATYANNDSYWMDLGFPVQTAPNGKRYKPLFAPLIVDLDSKINLFVHGNVMNGTNAANPHFSNQGHGPWEVNVGNVLTAIDPTTTTPEWPKLFNNSPISRYGINQNPDANPLTWTNNSGKAWPLNANPNIVPLYTSNIPPYYAPVDFGGAPGLVSSNPARFMYYPNETMPTLPATIANKITPFPSYPTNWDNATNTEITNHAGGYNPFGYNGSNPPTLTTDDRIAFAMSHLETLFRLQGTGSTAMTSDFLANLPNNMQDPAKRWLCTIWGMDVDRPGIAPFNSADLSLSTVASNYQYNPGLQMPQSTGVNFPTGGAGPAAVPAGHTYGEFDIFSNGLRGTINSRFDRRYVPLNSLPPPPPPLLTQDQVAPSSSPWTSLRVLLKRDLPPYPPIVNGFMDPTDPQYTRAQIARTDMAKEIYNMLIKVTGARDVSLPTDPLFVETYAYTIPPPHSMVSPGEYQACRWLAQLAINIVDFIDEDDIMTVWLWNPNLSNSTPPAPGGRDFVVGTELPQLVLNEIYAQLDDGGTNLYNLNVWLELHNPLRATANGAFPRNGGAVYLSSLATQNIYQVVLAWTQPGTLPPTFDPANPNNPTGTFSPNTIGIGGNNNETQDGPNTRICVFPAGEFVDAAGSANPYFSTPLARQGFYVMGPAPTPALTATDPHIPLSRQVGGLADARYAQLSFPITTGGLNNPRTYTYGVFLRRLANPYLAWNPLPPNSLSNAGVPAPNGYNLGPPFAITGPQINPYVTVDYFNNIRQNTVPRTTPPMPPNPPTGVLNLTMAGNPGPEPTMDRYYSWGRAQPYVGNVANWIYQTPLPTSFNMAANPPQSTFLRHNGREPSLDGTLNSNLPATLHLPFYWPVHMDRPVVNPIELLNVSCCRPWELTQRFGTANDHRAAWENRDALIYRLLEFMQPNYYVTPNRPVAATYYNANTGTAFGSADQVGGRVPGKINVNTIWDQAILDALLDLDAVASGRLFTSFMGSRSPSYAQLPNTARFLGPTDDVDLTRDALYYSPTPPAANNNANLDMPYKSMSTGLFNVGVTPQFPNGLSIANTILRANPSALTQIGLQQVDNVTRDSAGQSYPGGFPFKRLESIAKLFNSTTLRSNVFAMWLTVGFFEVVEYDTTVTPPRVLNPPKLMQEIGRSENRHIRHRMFAVIDRTNLMAPIPLQATPSNAAFSFPMTSKQAISIGSNNLTLTKSTFGQVQLPPLAWTMASQSPGLYKVSFTVRPGMDLVVEPDVAWPSQLPSPTSKQETVTVDTVNYATGEVTIKSPFTKTHNSGAPVFTAVTTLGASYLTPPNAPAMIYGNPGPQEGLFDVRQNFWVVPYFSVIQ